MNTRDPFSDDSYDHAAHGDARRDQPRGDVEHSGMRLTGTTQDDHDTLAELFLGDAPFAPTPMSDKPAPINEPPASVVEPVARPVSAGFDGSAVRALASSSSEQARQDQSALVELVVLGHLPVRASLWVRQYACQSARKRSETVALMRTAGDSVAIDLITGGERLDIEPIEHIEDAVTLVSQAASRVIVRVDETAEPELLGQTGVDEVTILTGADEAAVVASYRLIKSLMTTLEDRLEPDASPAIRVAVMGGTGEDIQSACVKIERACRAFLDRPVEVLDASGRIDATGTASVCRVDGRGVVQQAIETLLDVRAQHEPIESESGLGSGSGFVFESDAKPIALRLAESEAVSPAHTELEAKPQPRIESSPESPVESASGFASAEELPEVVVTAAYRSGEERQAERAAKTTSNMPPAALSTKRLGGIRGLLADLVPGLTPIEARCPRHPGVVLAADAAGGLHAVSGDDLADPINALVSARAWATENLALLIRAEPALSFPPSDSDGWNEDGIAMHLLTRLPARYRGVLDSEVLVYALASANAGGVEVLVATPLND